jgi:hypothetical protein
MAWKNTSSFPLCPDHRPGPTLMSARPALSGGHQATGVPTAIVNHRKSDGAASRWGQPVGDIAHRINRHFAVGLRREPNHIFSCDLSRQDVLNAKLPTQGYRA